MVGRLKLKLRLRLKRVRPKLESPSNCQLGKVIWFFVAYKLELEVAISSDSLKLPFNYWISVAHAMDWHSLSFIIHHSFIIHLLSRLDIRRSWKKGERQNLTKILHPKCDIYLKSFGGVQCLMAFIEAETKGLIYILGAPFFIGPAPLRTDFRWHRRRVLN